MNTIDLPNGTNFQIDFPFIVRDNDLATLHLADVLVNLKATCTYEVYRRIVFAMIALTWCLTKVHYRLAIKIPLRTPGSDLKIALCPAIGKQ